MGYLYAQTLLCPLIFFKKKFVIETILVYTSRYTASLIYIYIYIYKRKYPGHIKIFGIVIKFGSAS